MSKHDWSDLDYKVFYKRYDNPLELQMWLEKMKHVEGLDLVSFSLEYFVFKPEQKLELEEVCEWKFWWTEEYSGDPEDTPDSILNLITVCEWDYPELTGVALDESGDVAEFMMRVGYDYCPNCGKRIVYKESEE